MDEDFLDQEAQVVLGERLVAAEQERSQRVLEPLGRRLREQVRRWLAQGHHLRDLAVELCAFCLQLSQPWQHHIRGIGVSLEGLLPRCDAAVDVNDLPLKLLPLLICLAAEEPGLFDHVADEFAAALHTEEMIRKVFKHGAIELGHGEPVSAARLSA